MLLDGIHVPLTTPFYPDGRLNLRKLEHNVDRYSRTPAAGMLLTSPIGEGSALTDAETREAWAIAIAAAAPEKVMTVAVTREAVLPALELLQTAADLGYDAAMVSPPTGLQPRETMTFFHTIADHAPLPLVMVSERRRPLELEVIAELAQHSAFLGVMDEAGRVKAIRDLTTNVRRQATVTIVFAAVTARMIAKAAAPVPGAGIYIGAESLAGGGTAIAAPAAGPALKTRVRETGFQVLGATTATLLQDLRAGAVGAVPMLAACAPQACFEVLAGWKDGDEVLAEEKQVRLLAAAERMQSGLGVPGLKYACDLNGYFGGFPRLPLVLCSGPERSEIEEMMRGMRN